MIIFLCSGLWHGAAWHYVVWGGLNGLFSVMEDLVKPLKRRLYSWLKIDASKRTYKIFQRICTFILIDFTWLFFRAPSFQSGVYILKSIIGGYKWEWLLIGGYSDMFGTTEVMMIILLSLILVCAHDWLKYKGRDITESIFKQQILFRWGIYWLLLMIIVYWGVYGTGYEQTQFIYFQF